MIHWRSFAGILLLAWTAKAQPTPGQPTADYLAVRGISPNGLYSFNGAETVDTVSGNLQFRIPITSLPPGRAGFTWGLTLDYNSNVYNQLNSVPQFGYSGGWSYDYRFGLTSDAIPISCGNDNSGIEHFYNYYRMIVVFPDGSHHTLHRYQDPSDNGDGFGVINGLSGTADQTGCQAVTTPTPPLTYHTSDGTFVKLVITPGTGWIAYFPDGKVVQEAFTINAGQTITDRNGNKVTIVNNYTNNNPITGSLMSTVLSDDLNRTVTLSYNWDNLTDTITQAGSGSTSLTWTVNHRILQGPSYFINGVDNTNGSQNYSAAVVDKLSLPSPDGSTQQYQFGYDNDNDPNFSHAGQMTLVIPPTAPSTCTRSNLPAACPKFTYQYTGTWPNAGSGSIPHLLALTSRSHIWQEDATATQSATQRTDTWNYTYTDGTVTSSTAVANPDGGTVTTTYYSLNPGSIAGMAFQFRGLVTKITQPDQSTVERVWNQNLPYGSSSYDAGNPFVKTEFRSVSNGSAPTLVTATDYIYSKNGNVVQMDEYPWQTYSTPLSVPAQTARVRSTSYIYLDPVFTAPATGESINAYSNPASNPSPSTAGMQITLPTRKELDDFSGNGPGAVTQFDYDANGNLKDRFDWDSTKASGMPGVNGLSSANSSWRHFNYDFTYITPGHGNVIDDTDSTCITTTYTYDTNDLYLASVNSITEDNRSHSVGCTAPGTALTRVTNVAIDPATGLESQRTGPDGVTHTRQYDELGRLVVAQDSAGANTYSVRTNYSDLNRRITTCSDLATVPAGGIQATVHIVRYDQMGRPNLTSLIESPTSSNPPSCSDTAPAGILQETAYSSGNMTTPGYSYQLSSNPYRGSTEATMGWTLSASDQNGRVHTSTSYTGSARPVPWNASSPATTGTVTTTYNANTQTVTDEQNVTRTLTYDAQGRLTQVTEPGSTNTNYAYDALNNLTSVTQTGVNSRTFHYDSLGRLTTANNPETGQISYQYDAAGRLTSKTDGRFTTTLTPDALGRVVSKTYTDPNTPPVYFCYDGQTWSASTRQCTGTPSGSAMGLLTQVVTQLTSATVVQSSMAYSYDSLGRINGSTQIIGTNTPYSFAYGRNLAGQITSEQYPSQRTISYGYDGAGRISTVSGSGSAVYGGDSSNPILYNPAGAISSLKLGSGVVEATSYNARMQPTKIQAGTLFTLVNCYDSSQASAECSGVSGLPAGNNGNIWDQIVNSAVRTYNYDAYNRLTSASQGGGQAYTYDTRGNRAVTGDGSNNIEVPSSTNVYNGNNQNTNWHYDASGNVDKIPVTGALRMATYDAENRMTSVTNSAGTTTTYVYDGDGNRITKSVLPAGGTATVTNFVYDGTGNLVAEYGPPSADTGTLYLTADHLGSTRLTSKSGATLDSMIDYFPFGEEISSAYPVTEVAGKMDIKFTGKERDAETGLDFFGFRSFSASQGRFTRPDDPFNDQSADDPQSWNLFSYGRNNPLRFVDPSGATTCDENGNNCHDDVTVDGGTSNGVPWWFDLFHRTIYQPILQPVQQLGQLIDQFRSDPTCAGTLIGAGAGAGGIAGGYAGGQLGAGIGAGAGTLVEPGGGTLVGGGIGGSAGAVGGALLGGSIGGFAGRAAANVICNAGSGPTGGDTSSQSGRQDIDKKIKQFSNKSLSEQKSIYKTLKSTYLKHLEKYGQTAGQTSGETNRMERELIEMKNILKSRGQEVD